MSDNKEKDTNTKVVVNTNNEPKLTMLEKVCLSVSTAAITALTAVTLYDRFRWIKKRRVNSPLFFFNLIDI